MKSLITLAFLLTLLFSPAVPEVRAFISTTETGFLNRTIKVDGSTYRYQVYVPAQYKPEKKWPVILFLHGSGEAGDDGLLQTEVGIGTAIRKYADRFPSIVVFPQSRDNSYWLGKMTTLATQALDQTVKEFNGDERRLYLTGVSMGGFGAWYIAYNNPGKFAAIVPICGFVVPTGWSLPLPPEAISVIPSGLASLLKQPNPYAAVAQAIGKTPVWVFHSEGDKAVPVTESRKMVEALKAAGGKVKYNEFEGDNHNAWDRAYGDAKLLSWLLSQQLDK